MSRNSLVFFVTEKSEFATKRHENFEGGDLRCEGVRGEKAGREIT